MSRESSRKVIFPVVATLAVGALALLISHIPAQKPIDIFYKGTFAAAGAGAPKPLFVITNQSEYPILASIYLASQCQQELGWTRAKTPNMVSDGHVVRPHASVEVYGGPAMNVACRYGLLWSIDPVAVRAAPQWKRLVDGWFIRAKLRPPFEPFGRETSPIVPPLGSHPGLNWTAR